MLKKLFAPLLLGAVALFAFAACGGYEEDCNIYEEHKPYSQTITFTSTWAKTDDYFFLANERLYRLPLEDISQGQAIDFTQTEGVVRIVGAGSGYLFVAVYDERDWMIGRNHYIYQVSLDGLQSQLIDSGEYYGVPFFHQASNSILFARGDMDEGVVWLDSLNLDTGARHTFFEFESDNFFTDQAGWRQMDDGAVVFINAAWGAIEPRSDFVFIDADLEAKRVGLEETNIRPIAMQEITRDFMQENEDIVMLFSFGGVYIAAIDADEEESIDARLLQIALLSQDGEAREILAEVWHGHNSHLEIKHLEEAGLLMVKQGSFWRVDSVVQGLYCLYCDIWFRLN